MLKSLIGIRLRRLLSSLFGGKTGGAAIFIYSLVSVIFAGYSFLMGFGFGMELIPAGLDWIYFSFFIVISALVVFVFSIMETKVALFECKDNELLMAMPIRPIDILVSRCVAVYIINIIEMAILLIPALIAYLVLGGTPIYSIGFLLVALFVITLVTVISAIFGYLVALIASRFKHKNLVTIIVSVAFIAIFFLSYFAIMQNSLGAEEDVTDMLNGLANSLAFLKPIGDACMFSLLPFVIIAVTSIGITALAMFLMSRFYFRIITASHVSSTSGKKEVHINTGSAFTALAGKEIRRLFSSSGYLLNGGSGFIFQVLLGIMIIVSGQELTPILAELSLELGIEASYLGGIIGTALCTALPLIYSISASAVSLEGKGFWLLQSLPVDTMTVLYAKLVPHIVLSAPFTLASSIVFGIVLGIPALFWPFIIITPLLSVFVGSMLGLILNVRFPKLEYNTEQEVVKQSLPVFIMTMLGILGMLVAVSASLVVVIFLGAVAAVLITFILFLLLTILMLALLRTVTRKRFEMLLRGR